MKVILTFVVLICNIVTYSQAKPQAVIPFTIEKNVVYIYCKVNATDSLKFMFDTGANGSVINRSSGKNPDIKITGSSLNTGSNGSNEVEQSDNNVVAFGDIKRQDVSLNIIDFQTDAFDGVFGTDLMKGNIVEIDYNRNEIRFYNQQATDIIYDRYEKLKLNFIDNYPAIESIIVIEGKEYKGIFGLDSGADDLLTIAAPYAKKHKLSEKMRNIGSATAQGSDGSVYEMQVMLCPIINFSGKYLYNIPAMLSESTEGIDSTEKMAGFFGNNLLKRFNTIIDFNRGFIYFKLNKNLYFDVYQ
ncbi:aspartyl protease family protein [Flavobacterium rhizosphaerae]|uniref:Aspartyl protease family protein n=1 Tax=Flavobacterium rhizosphaerae TaxID=3163298 RepID=A0ABW8YXS3_9FLAO